MLHVCRSQQSFSCHRRGPVAVRVQGVTAERDVDVDVDVRVDLVELSPLFCPDYYDDDDGERDRACDYRP